MIFYKNTIKKVNISKLIVLCKLPLDPGISEKFLRIGIPFLLKCLVHTEGLHGDSCDTLEVRSVVMEIKIQTGNLLRVKGGNLMCCQEIAEVSGSQREDNLKMQGSPLPLDDGKAILPKLLPEGIFPVRLFVKEFLMQESVDGKLVKGSNLAFDKCKLVEGILQKKM